jgi:hypothetical protein
LSIALNADAGIIYFIDRISPEAAGEDSWGRKPESSELPRLRASSDLTWALWNRVAGPTRLQNIKYFMATTVVNPDSKRILIPRALKAMGVASGSPREWPGTVFNVNDPDKAKREAAEALIGKTKHRYVVAMLTL